MPTKLGLYENASQLRPASRSPAVRQFGGIKVFAQTQSKLEEGIKLLSAAICNVLLTNSTLTPSLTRYLVSEEIGCEVPRRVFSAVLGSVLRSGALDTVICEGSQGTAFRVVVHRSKLAEFEARVSEIGGRLCREKLVAISDVRDEFFSAKSKGDWTKAMFVVARLVRLGLGRYRDQFSIEVQEPIADAVLHANSIVDTSCA
jgi:hypothetical protein